MAQNYEFGDLDIQQTGGQEEAEFGALELQQAQVLFTSLNKLREGLPPLAWEAEAATEIEVQTAALAVWHVLSACHRVMCLYCRISRSEHLRQQLQQMTP